MQKWRKNSIWFNSGYFYLCPSVWASMQPKPNSISKPTTLVGRPKNFIFKITFSSLFVRALLDSIPEHQVSSGAIVQSSSQPLCLLSDTPTTHSEGGTYQIKVSTPRCTSQRGGRSDPGHSSKYPCCALHLPGPWSRISCGSCSLLKERFSTCGSQPFWG